MNNFFIKPNSLRDLLKLCKLWCIFADINYCKKKCTSWSGMCKLRRKYDREKRTVFVCVCLGVFVCVCVCVFVCVCRAESQKVSIHFECFEEVGQTRCKHQGQVHEGEGVGGGGGGGRGRTADPSPTVWCRGSHVFWSLFGRSCHKG